MMTNALLIMNRRHRRALPKVPHKVDLELERMIYRTVENESRLYECVQCFYGATDVSDLKSHMYQVHVGRAAESYSCLICAENYMFYDQMKRCEANHIEKDDSVVEEIEKITRNVFGYFDCVFRSCATRLLSKESCMDHIYEAHLTRPMTFWRCFKCAKNFDCKEALQEHLEENHKSD